MLNETTAPKRYQCCHILTGGHRCGSPALKQELFCYYHHATRKPVPPAEVNARKGRCAEFTLPRPEDRSAVQHAIERSQAGGPHFTPSNCPWNAIIFFSVS